MSRKNKIEEMGGWEETPFTTGKYKALALWTRGE
jgi:hypothetical protein